MTRADVAELQVTRRVRGRQALCDGQLATFWGQGAGGGSYGTHFSEALGCPGIDVCWSNYVISGMGEAFWQRVQRVWSFSSFMMASGTFRITPRPVRTTLAAKSISVLRIVVA